MRECPRCHESKPDAAYRVGHRPCRTCLAQQSRGAWIRRVGFEGTQSYQREYRLAHLDPLRERARLARWRRAHPDRVAAQRQRRVGRGTNVAAKQRRRARLIDAPVRDLTAAQWREIKAAAGGRCHYCHEERSLTMDHVVPLSKGGAHTASNVVAACGSCNSRKGARISSAA